jgi:dTDP-4-amino-4,6-dideoxygalactose transaminase
MDFNIDVDQIEAAITPRTKAVMPVHLNGHMADMERVSTIAERHRLIIIEDACQSLGASQNGRRAGSIGLTGCWSFYPFKILGGYGDGGAITTDDPDVAQFARRMRYNGEDRETGEYHGHGFTCLLDNLQAAFLDVKLRYLPSWIEQRVAIAERYREGLSNLPGLTLPHFDLPGFADVFQNYVVCSSAGDEFSNYLSDNGVEVLVQWRKPYYKHAALQLDAGEFPVTEQLSAQVCSLPMCVELEDEDVDYVIQTVRAFYGR